MRPAAARTAGRDGRSMRATSMTCRGGSFVTASGSRIMATGRRGFGSGLEPAPPAARQAATRRIDPTRRRSVMRDP